VLDKISGDLLLRYANICSMMASMRSGDVNIYRILNEERSKLHDEILLKVGTDRDNTKFSAELSNYIENFFN